MSLIGFLLGNPGNSGTVGATPPAQSTDTETTTDTSNETQSTEDNSETETAVAEEPKSNSATGYNGAGGWAYRYNDPIPANTPMQDPESERREGVVSAVEFARNAAIAEQAKAATLAMVVSGDSEASGPFARVRGMAANTNNAPIGQAAYSQADSLTMRVVSRTDIKL